MKLSNLFNDCVRVAQGLRRGSARPAREWLKSMTILALLLIISIGNAWGAENDTHDFAQTLEQVLNNGVAISDVIVAEQSYTVKQVIVSLNYNKSRPGATVSVTVGGVTFGSAQTINSSTSTTFTYTGASAVKGQVVVSSVNNCTSSSGNGTFHITNVRLVEGAAAVVTPYTVTFYKTDGSTQAITEASAGAGVIPPTMSTPCDGWAFQGWSKSQSNSTTSTTVLSIETLTAGKYYPSANTTLYPVYTKSGGKVFSQYQLITSASGDLSGQYLLSTGSITATGAVPSSGALPYESLTPGTTEKATKEFTVVKNGNNSNYFIKFPNGEYLGNKNNSTDLKSNGSTTAPTTDTNHFLWTLSTTTITNVNNSSRQLMYSSTNQTPVIKSYASSNTYPKIKLYKRIEADVTYYYSYPTCCTELASINGSFF